MKKSSVMLTAFVLAGCAAATDKPDSDREGLEYRRAAERIEAREQFEAFKKDCARSGGVVFVERYFGGRVARTPTAEEMKAASCSPPVVF